MIFYGFQKLTLLDYPGKTACTVFTAGCNFRCPFCHNASLATGHNCNESYTEDEIIEYLRKRKGILDGVAITGGEPLLNRHISDFIRRVKDEGFSVKLDTNGSFPERLEYILSEKLADYVAMDIKASEEKYPEAIGKDEIDFELIKRSIALLRGSEIDREFRTTAIKGLHTPEEIIKICGLIGKNEKYFIQNFVDSGNLIEKDVKGLSKPEMEELLATAQTVSDRAQLRGI